MLKNTTNLNNKKILIIEQGGVNEQMRRFKYYAYENTKNIQGGSYGPLPEEVGKTIIDKPKLMDQIKNHDIIIVIKTDAWLNDILTQLTPDKRDDTKSFVLKKMKMPMRS